MLLLLLFRNNSCINDSDINNNLTQAVTMLTAVAIQDLPTPVLQLASGSTRNRRHVKRLTAITVSSAVRPQFEI